MCILVNVRTLAPNLAFAEAYIATLWPTLHPARQSVGLIGGCRAPAREVPAGPQWAHEIKHDGYRFICRRDGDRVRVFSRRGLDWTSRVPAIVEAMRALRVRAATVDGEAVVVGADGVTDFLALRIALASRNGGGNVFLHAASASKASSPSAAARPIARDARPIGSR